MKNHSTTPEQDSSNGKSWTRTYVLVLLFNALLIAFFCWLSQSLNI
ncbi:MAG TPA: hypothetical protein VFV79_03925 [Saprospiraceae bacterium]|nr:hypothetical protein [Saprospiraceae bacterium]